MLLRIKKNNTKQVPIHENDKKQAFTTVFSLSIRMIVLNIQSV